MGYMDADGMSQPHCKAISSYALLIDGRSVSWRSHKQELITLSTTEAEYVAATHVAKEAVWLCNLLQEIFYSLDLPITLHCNDQLAIHLASNDNYHTRTKHIDIWYHFI